jgi:3-phosphoshikimate 1-carboxyvinyltransferase
MCFSLAAFNPAGAVVRIEDPKCVAKTFPDYFETLFSVAHTADHNIPVICIDGPTASGKGTLASELAKRLGYHYLDSGALYRIAALAALQADLALDVANAKAIAALCGTLQLSFNGDQVWLNGEDVSEDIRTESAGMNASLVSALPEVRDALLALQLSFRHLPGLVADGRDMGTVVFPDSTLKVYLTASADARATRRHKQLLAKDIATTIERLCADLTARDLRDTTRTVAPLKPAMDAVLLDNSTLSIADSIEHVLALWQSKCA